MKFSSLAGHTSELFELVAHAGSSPVDRLVSSWFHSRKYLGSRDRRFIGDAVFGLIRHRRYLETLLAEYVRQHPGRSFASDQRSLLLLAGLMASVDGAPPVPADAGWKEYSTGTDIEAFAGWAASHRSLDFLAARDPVERLAVLFSFQDWMARALQAAFADETEALLSALNVPAPTTLRVNTLKASREECALRLNEEGIATVPTRSSPHGLTVPKRFNARSSPAFLDGWFEIQDEGSQIVSARARPEPGNFVIDSCAGAGGKTLHFAALMEGRGEILAIDTDPRKLDELTGRAARAGIGGIRTVNLNRLREAELRERADLVFVDAPCSGSGTIRRHPALKWSLSEEDIVRFAGRQREVLQFNAQFVRKGGRLAYCTCSLLRQENEEIVQAFLEAHPDFRPFPPREGSGEVNPAYLLPHRQGTDGFFLAILERM